MPLSLRSVLLSTAVTVTAAAGAAVWSGGSASPASAAAAKSGGPVAHAIYSGGRQTDFRVGEPLSVTWKGEEVGSVCWQPAPIQHFSCSKQFAAPAKAGKQQLQVKTDSGKTAYLHLQIGAANTVLPTGAAAAGAGHSVLYRFTCGTTGRPNSGSQAKNPKAVAHTGDRLAAYYRSGKSTIQGFVYKTGIAAFYDAGCLEAVK